MDRGHVIADSLGGVANAYNITPQNRILNQHGDQAYIEKDIRNSGGAYDFVAIISYPNTQTMIPSQYTIQYRHKITNELVYSTFANANPDITSSNQTETAILINPLPTDPTLEEIDLNKNGQISIKEAKQAGFKMPITKNHWLYQYMTDGDGDGLVGE